MRTLSVINTVILLRSVLATTSSRASSTTHKPSKDSFFRRTYHSVAGLLHSSRGEAIVKEGTTTYLFNNPAYGSEFGSLSTRFSSRENPRKIKVRPWSLLPSSARLQISSKGLVEAGSVGLEFDKETPLWNGDSHPFLRLRSATCPSLQRLLSPLDEGSEWSAGARPEDIMAVVFPVAKLEDEDQVHGKKQRHDGESERTSGVGGMYEIRVNGKSHDALKDAIKLLYTVLPVPPWARMTAALSRMTANEYLVLATCFHVRGGNSLLPTAPPASSHPVDREKWMNFFNVRDIGGRGNKFSHLLVEGYTYSPPRDHHEGGSTATNRRSDILREAIGQRPPSNSLRVRRKRWSRTISTAEGELEFDLNQHGLLVLKDASCPRWNRPTPRKLSTRLTLSLFPAIFDDLAAFAHGGTSLPGILVAAGLTGDVQSALQTLLTIVRKPLIDVNYTGNANTAGNEFLLAALCSNIIANSPPVLGEEKPLDVVDDSTITTWGYRSIKATFPYMAAQREDIPDVANLSVRHNMVYDPRSRFWIQFGATLEADGNEFLILRSALCPFRNELAYGVSNLILTEVKRAVDYNAQAFPLSFPEAAQTARDNGGVGKFLFHTRRNRDFIEDSIKSLYVLMGGLPWKDTENRAEYSANGYFVHVMCVHLRGYTHSIPYREDTGMPAGAVKKKAGLDLGKSVSGIFAKKRTEEDKPEPLSGWIEELKVVEPPSATEFDSWPPQEYLMLGAGSLFPVDAGVGSDRNFDWYEQYLSLYGRRPPVEELRVEGGAVRYDKYEVRFLIESKYGLTKEGEGVLELYSATCPSFDAPTPFKPLKRRYAYRLFPTVYDDGALFSWANLTYRHGMRIIAPPDSDASLNRAVMILYRALPRPIKYYAMNNANKYFVHAFCEHLLKEEDLFMDERAPHLITDDDIIAAAKDDPKGTIAELPDNMEEFIKGISLASEAKEPERDRTITISDPSMSRGRRNRRRRADESLPFADESGGSVLI